MALDAPRDMARAFDGVELPFDAIPPLPGGAIWPANVFRALNDLDPAHVRAVIFGNDPYTKVEQATGRSFEQGDIGDWKTRSARSASAPASGASCRRRC
jgi:hypothetical protein